MMKLPKWLHIETIGQLKTTLVQVMIVILEVNLLKHGLVVRSESIREEALIIPASMVGHALTLNQMHTGKQV